MENSNEGQPSVTVVSVYYNRVDSVERSVVSLLNQTYKNLRVILVDDGSTDGTLELMLRYAGGNVKVLSHTNRGFTQSIKEVIGQCDSEYIAIHGSGDISHPNRISSQIQHALKFDYGIVGCWVKEVDGARGRERVYAPKIIGCGFDRLLRGNIYTHGEVLFKRRYYEEVGGYRHFFRYSQDYDLWLRMSKVCSCGVCPAVLYTRHKQRNSISNDSRKLILQAIYAEVAATAVEYGDPASGRDIVDKYGEIAIISTEINLRFTRTMLRLAMVFFLRGQGANAIRCIAVLTGVGRSWAIFGRVKID